MRVVLTGGGTGGHVVPNLAVIEELKRRHREVELLYIGSRQGMEKRLMFKAGVPYTGIFAGKWRRYFSLQNFVDIFKLPVGALQAYRALKRFKANVVFSKGGFVSVPVVLAAARLGIPVIIHESDLVPGLTNRICARFAKKICVSFEESRVQFVDFADKVVVTGNPVRSGIFRGKPTEGWKFTGLDKRRPVVLVMGGSQGAEQINELVRAGLNELLRRFQIVHIRGRGKLDISLHRKGYVQYEYLDEHLAAVYAISEMVITRGGANSLAEIAALKKKALVIPLGHHASRGDQITNAEIFARKFGWTVLSGEVRLDKFVGAVENAWRSDFKDTGFRNGVFEIVKIILKK